jgi:4-alpha-glucanotransferase
VTDWTAELCAEIGVHARYRSFTGETVEVSRETQVAVLRAVELDVGSDADARALLLEIRQQEADRPLPAEVIVQAGQGCAFSLVHAVDWVLEAEGSGEVLASGVARHELALPALALGIHRLRLNYRAREFTTWVLARPDSAIRLDCRVSPPRVWGVMAALYGLTDGDRAQIGTYELLGDYAAEMAAHGADFLGINPVHAMGQVRPDDVISPYSPSHRAFLNTWHCSGDHLQGNVTGEFVDYPSALKRNDQSLAAGFEIFMNLPASADAKREFEAFTQQAGEPLHQFALFEALSATHGPDWRAWLAPYRDGEQDALSGFEHTHSTAIQRIKWAQWQAERQLSEAQAKAFGAGMRVGLYLDLAVGPRLGGAETWPKDTSLVTGATLGAPPDPLGPFGQSWGLAPQSPLKCRAHGYAGFSSLLRSIMRHAGMIRIDHILGLMRSFWIPEGSTEGTYVSYPFEALLAVVAIESVRNNTIVVGEDLGLVPEGLRDKLATSGIYGLDVLQYMRTSSGGFCDPAHTRALAVCAFATHDTPTVAGFFAAEDAGVRQRLGSIDADAYEKIRNDRERARETLPQSDPVSGVHSLLARANSNMVAIQLDDIAGRHAQQNLPGTTNAYPNWKLKAPLTVAEIATSDAFAQLAADMRAHNRSNLKGMEKEHDLQDCSDHPH